MNASIIDCNQSDRGGLRLQDNRQTGQSTFDQSLRTPLHFDPPPLQTIATSLTVAGSGSGFRTIGRLVNQPSINHFERPSTSSNRNQSDRGGLRLQDNRQTGQSTFDQPPPLRTILHFEPVHFEPRPLRTPSTSNPVHFEPRPLRTPSTSNPVHFEPRPLRTPSTSNPANFK
ncbi:hypothetical protein N7465_006469 [Penicillium sp. CMV-2018d]|nr:hypothetical protein N7465_006469 [Penicillium sp. CMV-2018d]